MTLYMSLCILNVKQVSVDFVLYSQNSNFCPFVLHFYLILFVLFLLSLFLSCHFLFLVAHQIFKVCPIRYLHFTILSMQEAICAYGQTNNQQSHNGSTKSPHLKEMQKSYAKPTEYKRIMKQKYLRLCRQEQNIREQRITCNPQPGIKC